MWEPVALYASTPQSPSARGEIIAFRRVYPNRHLQTGASGTGPITTRCGRMSFHGRRRDQPRARPPPASNHRPYVAQDHDPEKTQSETDRDQPSATQVERGETAYTIRTPLCRAGETWPNGTGLVG